jgi:hypothetical protein
VGERIFAVLREFDCDEVFLGRSHLFLIL